MRAMISIADNMNSLACACATNYFVPLQFAFECFTNLERSITSLGDDAGSEGEDADGG